MLLAALVVVLVADLDELEVAEASLQLVFPEFAHLIVILFWCVGILEGGVVILADIARRLVETCISERLHFVHDRGITASQRLDRVLLRRFEFCKLLQEQCSPEAVEVADDLNATEGGLAFVQKSLLVQRLDVVELILIDDLLTARTELLEAVQATHGV